MIPTNGPLRPATAAEIIDKIVQGINQMNQPAPVSITVLQRLELIAFQPPGVSDDDFGAELCGSLPLSYEQSSQLVFLCKFTYKF